MSQEQIPHVVHCGFCEQGLVRLMRCQACQSIVAICDECELAWSDIAALRADPHVTSAGAFPKCPQCSVTSEWIVLDREAVREADLTEFTTLEDEP